MLIPRLVSQDFTWLTPVSAKLLTTPRTTTKVAKSIALSWGLPPYYSNPPGDYWHKSLTLLAIALLTPHHPQALYLGAIALTPTPLLAQATGSCLRGNTAKPFFVPTLKTGEPIEAALSKFR